MDDMEDEIRRDLARDVYGYEPEMVMIVARALASGRLVMERHVRQARLAIAAMREPTEAMTKAADAWDVESDQYCASGEQHWRAMIDAALETIDQPPQSP